MSVNNFALTPQPPATFTYLGQQVAGGPIFGGMLIGDFVNNTLTTPAGSAYNIPTVTAVSGVPVSAQLELQSTTGAFLVMRMTTTQRNALVTPTQGMIIYNTTANAFQFYQGSSAAWVSLSAGAGGVVGPGSSVTNTVATYADTSGAVLADTPVVIDGSGNVSAVNTLANAVGTAAAPSYTFTARTNTGLYSSAANTLDFATDGTRQLSVGGAVVAVNYLQIVGSVAASPVLINALGTDTNISVEVVPKGSGGLTVLTGAITASAGNIVSTTGNVVAGSSGNAGTVSSFSGTATRGSLILAAVANTGNTNTTISNAAMGQATVVSIPDPGVASTTFLLADNAGTQTLSTGSLALTVGNITATAGNVQAGSSGHAGTVSSFPGTAANGSLILAGVNAGGAFNTTISNGTMGQSTVYTLGDIGASTGGVVVATTALRMKSVAAAVVAGGAASQTVTDTFCTSGSSVTANWQTSTNAVSIQKVTAGNGSFIVLSSGDPGSSTLNYTITK